MFHISRITIYIIVQNFVYLTTNDMLDDCGWSRLKKAHDSACVFGNDIVVWWGQNSEWGVSESMELQAENGKLLLPSIAKSAKRYINFRPVRNLEVQWPGSLISPERSSCTLFNSIRKRSLSFLYIAPSVQWPPEDVQYDLQLVLGVPRSNS